MVSLGACFDLFVAVDFFGYFFFKRFILASVNPAHIHWTSRNPNTDFFFFVRKLCEVHCHPSLSGEQLAAALHFCAHVMHAY